MAITNLTKFPQVESKFFGGSLKKTSVEHFFSTNPQKRCDEFVKLLKAGVNPLGYSSDATTCRYLGEKLAKTFNAINKSNLPVAVKASAFRESCNGVVKSLLKYT